MGSVFSTIFGGGAMPSMETPDYAPAPERDPDEEAGIRDAERKKNRARAGGVRSTLLSNPLGSSATSQNVGGVLGRIQ